MIRGIRKKFVANKKKIKTRSEIKTFFSKISALACSLGLILCAQGNKPIICFLYIIFKFRWFRCLGCPGSRKLLKRNIVGSLRLFLLVFILRRFVQISYYCSGLKFILVPKINNSSKSIHLEIFFLMWNILTSIFTFIHQGLKSNVHIQCWHRLPCRNLKKWRKLIGQKSKRASVASLVWHRQFIHYSEWAIIFLLITSSNCIIVRKDIYN